MKFSLIKNMVGALAPTLGSALGGPLGRPSSFRYCRVFLVVKQILNLLIRLFKLPPQNKCLKLKKAEQDFELHMKELEVDVFKLEVARQTRCYEVRLAETGLLELLVLLLLVGLWVTYF
jgi:hypothetical protein